MKWVRSKPVDINELDEARLWHERYGGTVDGDPDEEAEETPGEQEDDDAEEELADRDGDAVMGSQSQANSTVSKVKQNPGKARRKPAGQQESQQQENANWI
jgi:hypothetical protein